jgi:hypothetical protein
VNKTGLIFAHKGEYVLDRNTTSSAESLARTNKLNQNQLLNMMSGSSGGMSFVFNRGVPPEERALIRQELLQMVEGAYKK